MSNTTSKSKFGTLPVFLTAISTILGAVMFLRFGYSVGSLGFIGTIAIIIVAHLVTIPTAMAIAELATNQKVEGGGEYFIISRSFGINIGASIGTTLYLSQAISIAFYVIAFAEAFNVLKPLIYESTGFLIEDNRFFSIPAFGLLVLLMVTKGADLGMKALYIVVATLAISIILFFLGSTNYISESGNYLNNHVQNPPSFFYVFAIIFPAFTGMTAGVGLSGDLKDPKKSIPLGTLAATFGGMIIYVLIAYKLSISASPDELVNNQLIMENIAVWGPIIPIGLAAATISSALGSFMVAPRTLQALGKDNVFPSQKFNDFTNKENKKNEPYNATLITSAIALFFILMGDVNAVAEIISMFFMMTYGSLSLISFLQHFAADPSYRPSFKSKWYISLLGAIMCIYLMFKMNPGYALGAIILMISLYFYLSVNNNHKSSIANIFQGVIFQFSRKLQVFFQKAEKEVSEETWRPSVICMSKDSFSRLSSFQLMKWISYRYGFGTYIHFIKGYYSQETQNKAIENKNKLIKMAGVSKSNVYLDTIINPSNTSAIIQTLQMPGISGMDNNMLLFEFRRNETEWINDVLDNYSLIKAAKYDFCLLSSSDKEFGLCREIHIWLTKEDYDNANLMILLSYIIIGHPDWRNAEIKINALYRKENMSREHSHLLSLVDSGRLPISANNINLIELEEGTTKKNVINKYSQESDLTVIGFHESSLKNGTDLFNGYDNLGNILFVNTLTKKTIA